ncbi:MAG: NYN domain-containing protein [bacterium]
MSEPNPVRIAILIDAENVLPSFADLIFTQADAMGEVVAREIYGVATALTTWVEPVLRYAIHPNLTIKATKSKNTSDIALVIGAMELLLAHDVNTVVIASSDSDFSGLSVRLRTAGIRVVGMGTDKSNPLWRTACTEFVVLEHPAPAAQPPRQPQQPPKPQPQPAKAQQPPKPQPQPPKAQPQQQPPKPQPQQPAKPQPPAVPAQPPAQKSASSHKERVAAIQQVIMKRLASGGGRVQASTLFAALNRLPEYRIDRQGSGKKPLNYLTSTFSHVFNFEPSADGKVWVTAKGPDAVKQLEIVAEPETVATEPEIAAEPETVAEVPAVEEAPVLPENEAPPVDEPEPIPEVEEVEAEAEEAVAEAMEPEAVPEVEEAEAGEIVVEVVEPEAVPEVVEAEEVPEVVEVPEDDAATDGEPASLIDRLIADGLDADVAETIDRILAESDNMFVAYNTLRRIYGNLGRDYYNRAKALLNPQ